MTRVSRSTRERNTRDPDALDAAVSLGHVLEHLRSYLRDHWEVLRHAQFNDPTLGFLVALEKARG